MPSLLTVGFFSRGKTRADLKCKGKEPPVSDKLTIDVIGQKSLAKSVSADGSNIYIPVEPMKQVW